MTDSLFQEGGRYKTRRIGQDKYKMTIPIPPDAEGLIGRECPELICSPGY
jgi:hypothetical protein